MNKKNILNYIVIFLLVYLIMGFFFGSEEDQSQAEATADFNISTTKKDYGQNELVIVNIKNNTEQSASIKNDCPSEPLNVLNKKNNEWTELSSTTDVTCESTDDLVIEPGTELSIPYKGWNHALFGEKGIYKISADIKVSDDETKSQSIESNEFEVKEQGWFGLIWTSGFYQPIYNVLIFLASIAPGNDLGIAIILLTILIRTILLIPSHKAMKSQRRMQELQPKLNKLKEKYKDNQEMIAKETMALWKEHKVNPMGSCLPLLIQFPFLIAIFYVVQTGLNPDNAYLLYGSLKEFSIASINVNFLGILNLKEINAFVLPIIVGGLQFLQMKLAMMRTKKLTDSDKNSKKDKKKKGTEMEMANQVMIYIMPVMIALFTASVPAGVGLYWSASTVYGIAQQFVVNKQVADTGGNKKDVKVRVVKNS